MTTTGVGRPLSPGAVFAACFLLAGIAAAQLAGGIGALFAVPQLSRHYAEAHADDRYAGLTTAVLAVLAVLSVLVAGLFGLLAALDGRGLGAARVITWVVAVPTLAVSAYVLGVGAGTDVAWYDRLTAAVAGSTAAFVAAASVLLALPAARRYYRDARAARLAARTALRMPPPVYQYQYQYPPPPRPPMPPPPPWGDRR